ncbi:hypothetical protein IMY05_013G0083600 [Salix suchowensis]|nr:hypothetical protein IMY05_013G0083600 [Salix suchowensis]
MGRELWCSCFGCSSISFFTSVSPEKIAIKLVSFWCFEVKKAFGSNWAVFLLNDFIFLQGQMFLMESIPFIGCNLIIELQGTPKVCFLAIPLLAIR